MPENVNTSVLTIDAGLDASMDDDRPTMIKAEHVSMVFNMASEQLNSLKEYAIKLARRELFFKGFTALDDVSFEVKKGDVFGIMGTNGSGKSTLLKIIAGVLDPSSGSCTINGNIAPLIELGAGFDIELTARENIYLNGALLGYSKQFITENFDAIVEFAEIEKFLDMPLKNYSSGMVARIAFAIATVIVPDILLVDEVLSVGDFMFQKKCEDRIRDLIETHGVTVLIVSHSNDQVARLCNKAIWIEKGHTRLMGDADIVARVYGGLGGRTGSLASEAQVFEALQKSFEHEIPADAYKVVAGENANSTNARLVLESWSSDEIDTVVLACDVSHANAVLAGPLAAAHDAPVLSVKPDMLPDSVERILHESCPERVFFVDCGGHAARVAQLVEDLDWHPELVLLDNPNLFSLSADIFAYGLAHGLWSDELALVHFDDNPESMVAAGYLCSNVCPVLMLRPGEGSYEEVLDIAREAGVHRLASFGAHISEVSERLATALQLELVAFSDGDTFACCNELSTYQFERIVEKAGEAKLCLASLSNSQWPDLLSFGSYAKREHAVLVLADTTSLDSIAQCLDFLHERKDRIGSVCFIGDKSGLGDMERKLFFTALEA